MEGLPVHETDIIDKFTKKKTLSGSLRVLIPLYATYFIFVLSVFLIFIPQQEKQLREQKKQTILQLTESVISLLAGFDQRIQQRELSAEKAKTEAISQIRNLRYGPEGKDYFWINDMHPFMIMHPYRPDLEGKDLSFFKDPEGNYPFIAMVDTVMKKRGGYVNYYWQWKDTPQKIVPKLSYVKGFKPWNWVIGTGVYEDDIQREINLISQNFIKIFSGILIFIILLSFYITNQVFKIEQKKNRAEKKRDLEALRLKRLLELGQMTEKPTNALTEFALEEAINLTESQIGYLAFLSEDESQLTMHTWSRKAMKQCEIKDKILIYEVEKTGLWAQAARTRDTVMINDYENDLSDGKKGYPKGHVPISRVLNVPVFDGTKMVALAGVGNKETDYDESDVRQLKLMMDGMWKIIQRKKDEDDLKRNEERYRILADNATDVIWIMEISDFRFSYVSPSIKALLGYLPDEYMTLEMNVHLTRESLEKVSDIISEELEREAENGIDKKRYRILELEMIKKDGALIWAEVTARFLRNKAGIPDRVLGITRDISQRKRLEQKLTETNAYLRLGQKIASIGTWTLDPQKKMPVWSDEIYRIFERDPELGPLTRLEFEQTHSPKWRKIFQSALKEAVSKGTPFDIEFQVTLHSGKIKWLNAICEPEPVPGPKGHYLRGTVQDITDRKSMERRIQQSQKMEALGTLAGGIAHDFNNILSSIMGFTELAKLDAGTDEELKSNLDQVLSAGLRARELVRHILSFSRKADMRKDSIRIVPLVKECLKFLKASVPPDIEIRTEFDRTDGLVLADPTQLHQVFMNLFTNAAYAMKEKGGVLSVGVASVDLSEHDIPQTTSINPGKHLQIRISDTGCGIPKHLTEKIFEPFFTTKNRGEGTGMGLSMVYGIIREMKGHISVYSEPGTGSSFHILMPEEPVGKGEDVEKTLAPLIRGKGRLLLVDDEPSIVEWTSQVLMKLGYDVVNAPDGEKALEIFTADQKGFDLILTDLSMPKMTGLEFAGRIKEQQPDIPIILCTGFSEGLTRESIQARGISAMVMKPMIAGELARILADTLTQGDKGTQP